MPFTAIRYDLLPGHADKVDAIFQTFRRPTSPMVAGADGGEAARILATAVFAYDDATLVRVIQYEGDLDAIVRYMATQPGVQEVERQLKPHLAAPRDTGTVEGFAATFAKNTLRRIAQLPP